MADHNLNSRKPIEDDAALQPSYGAHVPDVEGFVKGKYVNFGLLADDKNIKAKVLICQGGDDKFTLGDLPALKKSLSDAKVDYKVVIYPGAVHGFTNPENTGKMAGVKYDANADKMSWSAMLEFFKSIFKS